MRIGIGIGLGANNPPKGGVSEVDIILSSQKEYFYDDNFDPNIERNLQQHHYNFQDTVDTTLLDSVKGRIAKIKLVVTTEIVTGNEEGLSYNYISHPLNFIGTLPFNFVIPAYSPLSSIISYITFTNVGGVVYAQIARSSFYSDAVSPELNIDFANTSGDYAPINLGNITPFDLSHDVFVVYVKIKRSWIIVIDDDEKNFDLSDYYVTGIGNYGQNETSYADADVAVIADGEFHNCMDIDLGTGIYVDAPLDVLADANVIGSVALDPSCSGVRKGHSYANTLIPFECKWAKELQFTLAGLISLYYKANIVGDDLKIDLYLNYTDNPEKVLYGSVTIPDMVGESTPYAVRFSQRHILRFKEV